MQFLRHVRLVNYSLLLGIVWLLAERPKAIPVDLSSSRAHNTSVLLQMLNGEVLSSYVDAEEISAQVVWSDEPVYSSTSADIKARSEVVRVNASVKALIITMLSSPAEYQDDGSPCLCHFQPQLRLTWSSQDRLKSFCVLVSGLSHGEIQSYCDGIEKGRVRDGVFIPTYLKVMDRLFPEHPTTAGLKKYDVQRQADRAKRL